MIKVLHYVPGFLFGGIETCVLNWYRNIDRTKIQFVLVKLNNVDNTEYIREFTKLGGIVYNLPPFRIPSVSEFQKSAKEILKKEHIDIIHVHDVTSGCFMLRLAKKLGIKQRILHSHTIDFLPNEKNYIIKRAMKFLAPIYANKYFACSKEAGEWGCGNREIEIIKNGIEVEQFVFRPEIRERLRKELDIEDKVVVGCIGRLTTSKNIPFLLDVLQQLLKENVQYRLLIVGDGNRSILEDYYKSHDIESKVIFVGEKNNVSDYYSCIDVFCAPSIYEGFGITAIEAQASGVPTIVSKAFPDVVEISSFIKRLEINQAEKWCEAINSCLGKRYSTEGQQAVVNAGYTAKAVAKQLENFYEEMM